MQLVLKSKKKYFKFPEFQLKKSQQAFESLSFKLKKN